ncbi:MAG: hypothetical protein IKD00_05630 [Candidatus Methanomethylophilaceae archaeon]|nr:hypothetical protein [Candidatus Methanomethylophilaceae archaeon]
MFKGIKSKGIDLFTLVTGLMVHSMDEDNSLAATAQWMFNPVVKSIYGIPEDDNVSQKTLNRALEALGANDEVIVVGLNKGIGRLFPGLDHDAIADGSSIVANSDHGELAAPGHPRDRNPDGMQVEFMLGMMGRSRIPFHIRTFPVNTSDEEVFSTSLPEMMGLLDYGDMHSHDDVKDRLLEDMERRRDERRQGRKGRGRPK